MIALTSSSSSSSSSSMQSFNPTPSFNATIPTLIISRSSMASHSLHRDPHSPRRGSTSQMCLHRILTIIATVPPPADDNPLPHGGLTEWNSPEPKEPLSSTSSGAGVDRARRNLSLLIQAAQLIFGEFADGDELKSDAGIEPETGGEFEESAAGRSKRGRTRVLPCRYRDSVLEPLTRFSRTILPPKRRRR